MGLDIFLFFCFFCLPGLSDPEIRRSSGTGFVGVEAEIGFYFFFIIFLDFI